MVCLVPGRKPMTRSGATGHLPGCGPPCAADPIAPSPSPAPAAAHALAPPPPSDLDFLRPARAGLAGLAAKPPLFGGVPQLPPSVSAPPL